MEREGGLAMTKHPDAAPVVHALSPHCLASLCFLLSALGLGPCQLHRAQVRRRTVTLPTPTPGPRGPVMRWFPLKGNAAYLKFINEETANANLDFQFDHGVVSGYDL